VVVGSVLVVLFGLRVVVALAARALAPGGPAAAPARMHVTGRTYVPGPLGRMAAR
jgi:hypothetical protein